MPPGIRPINDFAFKKTFGTPENRAALISLLNAILRPTPPIVEVTLENPFNLQDFEDDKLSILDVKAVDRAGAIYDIEMQLAIFAGPVQRIVFYGCQLYADQLKARAHVRVCGSPGRATARGHLVLSQASAAFRSWRSVRSR
jgi:predicted transposase/invertase (TIGR01784 family)